MKKGTTREDLKKPMSGLIMMSVFTLVWVFIASTGLDGMPRTILALLTLGVIVFLAFNYYKFYQAEQKLALRYINKPEDPDKKKTNQFLTLFALEALAILVAKNILININLDHLFIPVLALIVGLHFFFLSRIFNRKFDIYVALWTVGISVIGLFLLVANKNIESSVVAFVGVGGALATIAYALKIINDGNALLK